MHRRGRNVLLLAVIAITGMAIPCSVGAQDTIPGVSPAVATVLARLSNEPTLPREYSANIDLHVKLRVFPFIGLTLHGNSSFKRPGLYHFVFRGVPKAIEKFNDMNYDLGDPTKWTGRYEIALAPQNSAGSPVIRLTPRAHGALKWLDVSIDPDKGHMLRAVWTRYDGGVITLVQTYATVGENEIVSRQIATIDLPHMRADVSADYAAFVVSGMPVLAGLPPER